MKIIVLAYHRIYPLYHISPDLFESQIKILKEKFTPLTLDQVIEFTKGNLNLKKDGFAITFDDGWADNFIYAYPILKKLNVPATIFISTSFISDKNMDRSSKFVAKRMADTISEFSKNKYSEQFLTWNEIKEMQPLFSFESHGHTHAYQFVSKKSVKTSNNAITERQTYLLLSNTKIDKSVLQSGSSIAYPRYDENTGNIETVDNFTKSVEDELKKSMDIIELHTGRKSNYLAWPFGEYNKASINVAKKSGIKACFTIKNGIIKSNSNAYELKRFSPPRSEKVFKLVLNMPFGIELYNIAVFMLSFYKKLQKK